MSGKNFTWCGQSCGSTSRAFLHAGIHDAVVERLREKAARFRPGLPDRSRNDHGRAGQQGAVRADLHYIETAKPRVPAWCAAARRRRTRHCAAGSSSSRRSSRTCHGHDDRPGGDLRPRAGRHAVVGGRDDRAGEPPVYGLTCSIWTNDIHWAHRTAAAVEAGFVWVTKCRSTSWARRFGGFKQSGLGAEECLEELLAFTQERTSTSA